MVASTPAERFWTRPVEEVLAAFGVRADEGLSIEEAARRLALHGPNRLEEGRPVSAWTILARQFRSLVTLLLAAAAAAAFAYDEVAEGLAIAAVILLNAGIGFATELRAVRSMEALRRLGTAVTRVLRAGRLCEIPADELVPGDLVILEAGDLVTADLRLVRGSRLQADESQLTGESLPVDKRAEVLPATTPLAERACLLYRGSAVVRGGGEGVATATGARTELGRIARLAETATREATPLEERLDRLGRNLAWVALGIAAVTAAAGVLAGRGLFLMIETGIALAVAAIPEGLPIVATLALARGVWRMAERDALVNRLSAVETLGALTVICTDKTGTLTENRMTVIKISVEEGERDPGDPDSQAALTIGALCNNASLGEDGGGAGDPLEVALLAAAARAGIDRGRLLAVLPEVREESFDSERRMMATVHRQGEGEFRVAVKGAPEGVLAVCSKVLTRGGEKELAEEHRREWLEREQRLAGEGYRVLALAERTVGSVEAEPYADLTWVGLALLEDPPRLDVREALASCRAAGIQVVMVTGDQAATARTIAREVGLLAEGEEPSAPSSLDLASRDLSEADRRRLLAGRLFARMDPERKLDLIALHQEAGGVVAMTGDGVNDAPALRKAGVGVAMGRRGSQVAREAADVVLKDDSFATIAVAVRQGRVIFGNIRRSALFLIACNASEVMVVASAALLDAPLPVLPLQLLFLNLVTDVFPALALGLGEGDPRVMERPPRDPREPLLTRRHWLAIGGLSAAITVAVLGALYWSLSGLGLGEQQSVTVAFLTLAFAQLWQIFNMRQRGSGLLVNEVTGNPYVWGALLLCAALLLLAVGWPPLAGVLRLTDPGPRGWGVVVIMSLAPVVAGWAANGLSRKSHVRS